MTEAVEFGSGATQTAGSPERPQRRHAQRSEKITRLLFVAPAAVVMAGLFGYPVVKNIVMGFQDYQLRTFFTGAAPWTGLGNYVAVVTDSVFGKAMLNTAVFSIGSIVGQFVLGMLLALFFRRKFPLSGVLRALLLLPWLLPLIVSSASWRSILDQDSGPLNRILGGLGVDSAVPWLSSPHFALFSVILVNIWIGIPFNTTLLYSGLMDIPAELYEAGSLDGAGRWKTFWHITWPNLRPVIGVVLVLGIVYTLKVLDIILGLTGGGPSNATDILSTRSYHKSFVDFNFGQGAALSNILIIISLFFALFYLRSTRRPVDE